MRALKQQRSSAAGVFLGGYRAAYGTRAILLRFFSLQIGDEAFSALCELVEAAGGDCDCCILV